MKKSPRLAGFLLLGALAFLGQGCASKLSKSSGGIPPEVPLKESERGAALVYRSESIDILRFKSFYLPPARIYRGEESRFDGIGEEDKRRLAARLRDSFAESIGKGYAVVNSPAPDALTLQLTLVDVTTSVPVASTALRLVPIGLAISAGKSAAGSGASLTGAVRVAGEIRDAQGELVSAFVLSEHPLALDLRSGLTKFYATEIAIDQVAANFKKAVDRAVEERRGAR